MEKEDIRKAVFEAAVAEGDRRTLQCAEAFRLADELGVQLTEIAAVCQSEDVRICRCQLGCFK